MADQNIFAMIEGSTPRAAVLNLQSKLHMIVICHHRDKKWSKKKLRTRLGATKAQAKAVRRGYLDKLSTDLLLTWVSKLGYDINTEFNKFASEPLVITVANRSHGS